MSVFAAYSEYYDLLYADKDYEAEAEFVAQLCRRFRPTARTLLELGCGTARHAVELARRSFDVHGVEISETMYAQAVALRASLSQELASRLSLQLGDARTVRVPQAFDVVSALFHVVSYQVSSTDLESVFRTAATHLDAGGLFIFDCWYGPAVVRTLPETRLKTMQNDRTSILRFAEPTWLPRKNAVEVRYRVLVQNVAAATWSEIQETHLMRYLFDPEVEYLAAAAGFDIVWSAEFLTGREPGPDTWSVCYALKKRPSART